MLPPRARNTLLWTLALLLTAPVLHAQLFPINLADRDPKDDPNIKLPIYDVASVKENKSGNGMMRIMNKPDGFSCTNISLKTLIGNAYGLRQDLISGGPGWANSTGFDVEAKVAGEDVDAFKKLTPHQRNSLLKALLEDRFKLKLHTETKTLTMYELVIAKGGYRLKPGTEMTPDPDAPKTPEAKKLGGMISIGPGFFTGQNLTITAIVNQLSNILHYTVTDKTGLTGNYDIELKWTPDDARPPSGDASSDAAVSIFTAVQEQLGLKLQATKGPVETLVIDQAEMPSAN
jgi:uncharacterized protein (TIGR03435 family)